MEQVVENKTQKKGWITAGIVTIVSVSAIALGLFAGYYLKYFFSGDDGIDYDNINVDNLADDNAALIKKYENSVAAGTNDFTEVFKSYEAANVGFTLFCNEEHSMAQGKGVGDAGITAQAIRSTIIRDSDSYFEESLSYSSFVNIADRMYQSGESVQQYVGNCKNGDVETGTYPSDGTTYTLSEYSARMGRTVSDRFIYVVSSKTTMTGEEDGTSGTATSFVKNDSGYQIELELNPVSSVVNYVKQMQTLSNLASKPSFSYVHLSITLNSDLQLVSMTSTENYYAKTSLGIGSKVTGTLTTEFSTGGSYAVPELNDPITYA
ncbi:MAG: hypothetical protein LKF75_01690 [Bacilli bacterium]|jgi:hypothetical protein|nr:hypothetical protein [Bacilli bacterium]MCH4210223.1 hypothetical protein [Bacilli bacterium]MCH4228405.1 hypothetical protein [Bacilli bacterium]MCH4277908.1 hypothetical protein [Bacilli bacterium]MCI2054904.1 hypothetical protein [Bacilli bacterium]